MSVQYTSGYLVANFTRKLINSLVGSEDVVTIMNPTQDDRFDIRDILLGGEFMVDGEKINLQGYIFDHYFVPDTTVEGKVFICVEANVDYIDKNIISEFPLDVYIFTYKTNVRLTDFTIPTKTEINEMGYLGNRISAITDAVDRVLRGMDNVGLGLVIPSPRGFMKPSAPDNNYYGKKLSYQVKGYTPKEVDVCGN